MKIKPAPGVKVRDPASKLHLPVDGMEVTDSSYWQRRLAAGDVVMLQTNDVKAVTVRREAAPKPDFRVKDDEP